MAGVGLKPYKLVEPGDFAYVTVTSRNGEKITIAENDTLDAFLVSSSYEVFRVADCGRLNPRYLFLIFNRPEFDRYARFNSWGSARETFSWEDMCDVELELPSIDIQRKYVAIYEAMLENQRSYEQGLDDLKLTCDALYDRCKRDGTYTPLSSLLMEVDKRNTGELKLEPMGVTLDQQFQPSKAALKDESKYKLAKPGQIVVNLIQIGRDAAYPIALNTTTETLLTSPDYRVFEPKSGDIAHFLMGWFARAEVGRQGWFICDDGVRGRMSIDKFLGLRIPVPSEELLNSIAELRVAYQERVAINERLKAQLKDICPILIKGSLEERAA